MKTELQYMKEPRFFYWLCIQLFILLEKAGTGYEAFAFCIIPLTFFLVKGFIAKNKNNLFWTLFISSLFLFAFFIILKNPFEIFSLKIQQPIINFINLIGYNGYYVLIFCSVIILWLTFDWEVLQFKIALVNSFLNSSILILLAVPYSKRIILSFLPLQTHIIYLLASFILFLITKKYVISLDEQISSKNKKPMFGGNSNKKKTAVVKFGPLEWNDRDFPRGWSITGETGSGKTEAAFKSIFIQLCKNRPNWGGVLLDQKGNLHEEIEDILKALGMEEKALVLKTRPLNAVKNWTPKHRFNLLSIPWIDDMTYAKMICDVAVSAQGGKGEDKSFFSTQALIQIASGIKLLRTFAKIQNEPIYKHVGLAKLYTLLSSQSEVYSFLSVCSKKIAVLYEKLLCSSILMSTIDLRDPIFKDVVIKIESNMRNLEDFNKKGRSVVIYESERSHIDRLTSLTNVRLRYHPLAVQFYLDKIKQLPEKVQNDILLETGLNHEQLKLFEDFAEMAIHFNEKFLAQPPDQLGGVTSTIFNYLMFFNEPDVADVFSCETNTFDFCKEIDNGKIVMLTMPQSKAVHRIFVNTTLKLLFYQHALSRFDLPKAEREAKNLIVLFADEAQGVVSKMEGGGFEDHAVADKIRQANATIVFATQDLMSYEAKIGKERSATLQLNLANKIVFKCATPEAAEFYSKFFGKQRIIKKTGYSSTKQGKTMNYQEVDEPVFKDFDLTGLRKFEAVVKHCEKPPIKMILPPVDNYGNVAEWAKPLLKSYGVKF